MSIFNNTEKISPDETKLFEQLKDLSILCAQGIVKISRDTHYPPAHVAKMFLNTFQKLVDDLNATYHT